MRKMRVRSGDVVVSVKLGVGATANAVWAALPFTSTANRWGMEVYFSSSVKVPPEREARDVLSVGEVGYWPPGRAICLFFGPTPASRHDEPRAASAVNVFGRVEGDPLALRFIEDGATVLVEAESPLEAKAAKPRQAQGSPTE
jgi:uncharacterized protein